MELRFKGGNEYIRLVINRKKKEAMIQSRTTQYTLTPIKWKMLFDKGKEKAQERMTDGLKDEEFKTILMISMAQQGYSLVEDGSR